MTHGTITQYRKGCRCDGCSLASRRSNARGAYFKARGISRRRSVVVSKRIIKELRKKGWPISQIGNAANISDATLDKILNGKQKFTLASTENRLRALVAEDRVIIPKEGHVDADLPRRAVRGLAAQSWPYTWVADQVDVSVDTIYRLAMERRKFILAETAERIYTLVREVGSDTGPHAPSGTKAANKGWLPTMYIDELV